jgi:hypothetical protein
VEKEKEVVAVDEEEEEDVVSNDVDVGLKVV